MDKRNQANDFLRMNEESRASYIADYCNKNGISKTQLAQFMSQFK